VRVDENTETGIIRWAGVARVICFIFLSDIFVVPFIIWPTSFVAYRSHMNLFYGTRLQLCSRLEKKKKMLCELRACVCIICLLLSGLCIVSCVL
jgi:hypothetical protein